MNLKDENVSHAGLRLDPVTRDVMRGTRRIDLTAKEFDLLRYFLRHPRQVLSRDQILQDVWGYDFGGEDNVLEVYVGYLRKKMEVGGEPRLIQTVRGVGCALRDRGASQQTGAPRRIDPSAPDAPVYCDSRARARGVQFHPVPRPVTRHLRERRVQPGAPGAGVRPRAGIPAATRRWARRPDPDLPAGTPPGRWTQTRTITGEVVGVR